MHNPGASPSRHPSPTHWLAVRCPTELDAHGTSVFDPDASTAMMALVPDLVSICIPAWERPEMTVQGVQSCLAQTYGNIEVLITDDSRTDAVRRALQASGLLDDPRVRYVRNIERLGQAGNVNRLFELARGERLVLLHDDDLLLPDAVEVLSRCWRDNPELVASYGTHYIVTQPGRILTRVTEECNRNGRRTARHAGAQKSALWAVLARQFPPDGFMLRTAVARATPWRPYAEVGDACDLDFALRLARQPGGFCYVDHYVSKYRLTEVSVTTESTMDPRYQLVCDLEVPPEVEEARQEYLRNNASYTFRRYVLAGQRRLAWRMLRAPGQPFRTTLAAARPSNLLLLVLPTPVVRGLFRLRYRFRAYMKRNDVPFWFRELRLRLSRPWFAGRPLPLDEQERRN